MRPVDAVDQDENNVNAGCREKIITEQRGSLESCGLFGI
jgi:hypothetical protein